jgi:hypothetical protein
VSDPFPARALSVVSLHVTFVPPFGPLRRLQWVRRLRASTSRVDGHHPGAAAGQPAGRLGASAGRPGPSGLDLPARAAGAFPGRSHRRPDPDCRHSCALLCRTRIDAGRDENRRGAGGRSADRRRYDDGARVSALHGDRRGGRPDLQECRHRRVFTRKDPALPDRAGGLRCVLATGPRRSRQGPDGRAHDAAAGRLHADRQCVPRRHPHDR